MKWVWGGLVLGIWNDLNAKGQKDCLILMFCSKRIEEIVGEGWWSEGTSS